MMTKYLLLRNNKESGPFVLDELIAKGLKAYDLVWIEGKSAAWRYPCEIQELSPYAPAVEEQPFDRFFKKPTQTDTAKDFQAAPKPDADKGNTVSVPFVAASPVMAGEPSAIPGKRIIYVTLPAKNQQPSPSIQRVPAVPVPERVIEKSRADKFAQPSEDWSTSEDWKTIVEMVPRRRKVTMTGLWRPLLVALTVVVLLAAGIFIGLSINSNRLSIARKLAVKDAVAANNNAAVEKAPPLNTDQQPSGNQPGANPLVTQSVAPPTVQPPVPSTAKANETPAPPVVSKSRKTAPPAEKTVAGVQKGNTRVPAVKKDSMVMHLPIVQREAVHRTDLNTDKLTASTNLANQVSVDANGYTVGTFGGISGLQLTVNNHSIYPLDLVVVEVQYIQANKKIYKTEHLDFHDIGAGAVQMLEAPKTSRGIKVLYRITLISSKAFGLSYSAI